MYPLLLFSTLSGVWQWLYTRKIAWKAHSIESVKKSFFHHTNYSIDDFKNVTDYVQQRLHDLQHPFDCANSQKVVCDTRSNGFGSKVHLLTICFTVGFITNRTVIMESNESQYSKTGWKGLLLPLSNNCTSLYNQSAQVVLSLFKSEEIQVIKVGYKSVYVDLQRTLPRFIVNVVKAFHSDPQLWWAGQIAQYILRPTQRMKYIIAKKKKDLGFQNVIVGLQVRRTDKLAEAYYYNLKDYMNIAEKWYTEFEKKTRMSNLKRRFFLATDVSTVVNEAQQLYPNYVFVNDINATIAANNVKTRYTFSSLADIIVDIYLLSSCDYLVCTMTSNVCRLAFELMQNRHTDGSKYAKSLDCDYYIQRLYKAHCKMHSRRVDTLKTMIHNTL